MKDGASMTKTAPLIYVVDDDASVREALSSLIRSAGLRVEAFASAQEFLAHPQTDAPSCLVLDVQLPGLSGLELQQELAKADVQIPIIFLTGHGDIPMSVRAIKAGAMEFLTKPFDDEVLLDAIQQGIARNLGAQVPTEIGQHSFEELIRTSTASAADSLNKDLYLDEEVRSHVDFDGIVGKSPALRQALHLVETVA